MSSRRAKRGKTVPLPQLMAAVPANNTPLPRLAKVAISFLALVFLVMCALLIYVTEIQPRFLSKAAENWIEIACVIRKCEVQSHSLPPGHKSTSGSIAYSPLIEFEYQWQGKTYSSSRYWFGGTLWHKKQDVKDLISPFKHATEHTCLVNPDDPTQAVLTRNLFLRLPVSNLTILCLATVSFLIVSGFVCFSRMPARKKTESADVPETKAISAAVETEVYTSSDLKSAHLWIVALVWNGIVLTIAHFAWVGGAPFSFFIFFLAVFWLVGLLLVALAWRKTIHPLPRK